MCDCMTKVNEALAAKNGRIAVAFGIGKTSLDITMRVLVATEKNDKSKRKPVPPVAASYCPFCGEKFEVAA